MKRCIMLVAMGLLLAGQAAAQFVDIGASIDSLHVARGAWGDYDGDGDLDLVVGGRDSMLVVRASVYRNDAGAFINIGAGLAGAFGPGLAWGDFDNDGDLDLLVTGANPTALYRNDSGSFADISPNLPAISQASPDWGDYDNDGDLDLLMTGAVALVGTQSFVFRNDNGSFADIGAGLTAVDGDAIWHDLDGDGDLDIAISGAVSQVSFSTIYRNDNGLFTEPIPGGNLMQLQGSMFAAGDYDADGDLDLLLGGRVGFPLAPVETRLYDNNGSGAFSDSGILSLLGLHTGDLEMADYDADGDLDLLASGYPESGVRTTMILRNDAGSFVEIPVSSNPFSAWGDYDNDGDLDVFVSSNDIVSNRILRNDGAAINTVPGAPSELTASLQGSRMVLAWDPAVDTETPSAGLSYNLRIGTTPGGSEIKSAMAAVTGRRHLTEIGNVNQGLSWPLDLAQAPPGQPIYWSVQAIDGALAGGPFAPEDTLEITDISPVKSFIPAGGAPGDTVTLRLAVQNLGAVDATGVVIADTLDAAFTYLSQDASQGSYSPGTGLWTLGTVVVGEVETLELRLLVNPSNTPLQILNTAHPASMDQLDSIALNDTTMAPFAVNLLSALPPYFFQANAGDAEWGDYDNDGDLDILLAGINGGYTTQLYRNDNGTWAAVPAGFETMFNAAIDWVDYDGDGDLDVLLTGWSGSSEDTRIYRNDGGAFADIGASIGPVQSALTEWGDYDNDGDPDLLLAGLQGGGAVTFLYRNDAGVFSDVSAPLDWVRSAGGGWADHDGDGDLDLLIAGYGNAESLVTKLYRNDAATLVAVNAGPLPHLYQAGFAWGDYDNDGDPDFVLAGIDEGLNQSAAVFRNDAGTFVDIAAGITGVKLAKTAWGDVDNDGDLDLVLNGETNAGSVERSRIYRNDAGSFVEVDYNLTDVSDGSATWGDYDNDGDLDLLVTGWDGAGGATILYRNEFATPNTLPTTPTAPSATINGGDVLFSWSPATDAETPAPGLTYNLRIGTTPGGDEISASMAAPGGLRRIPAAGNAGGNLSWPIDLSVIPLPQTVYWGVQAVDANLAGSPFATGTTDEFIHPEIQSIVDVGNDQGRQVSIEWRRSAYDGQLAGFTVTDYSLWRRVDPLPAGAPSPKAPVDLPQAARSRLRGPALKTTAASWHYIDTVPAGGVETYVYVSPTLCDSTIAGGQCESVFFVSAMTSDPLTFWDSPPDSGYSQDNLPPAPPQNLAHGTGTLSWDPAPEPDFDYHTVYGSEFPTVDENAVLVEQTSSTGSNVTGQGYTYYHVTTTDFSGNEGAGSSVVADVTGADDPVIPAVNVLHANQPNPFTATTRIRFGLAEDQPVELTVHDIQGRLVRRLAEGVFSAREHTVTWDGRDADGVPVASGIYLYRLRTPAFEKTRRLVLLR